MCDSRSLQGCQVHGIVTDMNSARLRVAALLCWCLVGSVVSAQRVHRVQLSAPTGRLSEPFTSIWAVRELSDGRVLVTDPSEVRLALADFRANSTVTLGRRGRGPGEYSTAQSLFATVGDSSLLVDPAARRWLIFDGPKVVRTTPPDAELVRLHRLGVLAADSRGFVWRGELPPTRQGVQEMSSADSGVVIRTHVATGAVDTMARLRMAPMRITVAPAGAGMVTSAAALAVGEQLVVFRDGWFAVARLSPYRLQVYDSEGKLRRDLALPNQRIPFTSREREAYLQRAGNPLSDPNALRAVPPQVRERIRRAFSEFPTEYPPIAPVALIASPDGTVLIRKPETTDLPHVRYDVVDRLRGFRGTLQMGEGERVVGFGKRSIYVAWKDQDDVERLRRHPWP